MVKRRLHAGKRGLHYWCLAKACQRWLMKNNPAVFNKLRAIAEQKYPAHKKSLNEDSYAETENIQ